MKSPRSSLFILFSVIVLDLIGFGVVIPILPFYAELFGANATVLGLLLTSYAGMQFLFSPLWGKASDRIGRKKVLLFTMAGSVLGLVILGSAQSLTQLFIGRIVSGIFGANISVATAYVTDVTTEENRAKGMGLIGAAFGIGFILGPALGGILSIHGYAVPILTAAGLGALNIVYAFFRLGESQHSPTASPSEKAHALGSPSVRKLCLLNLLFTLAVTQLEATFAFFMMDRFQYDAKEVAYILVFMAFIMVVIQGGLIRRLAQRFGEKNLLLAGSFFLTIGFVWVPLSYRIAVLLVPLSIASLGRGISQPSLLSMVSKSAPAELRGSVMGTFQSAASLARVLGPVSAGFLYDRWHSLPFYLAALLMVTVMTLALYIKHPVNDHARYGDIHPDGQGPTGDPAVGFKATL
jgi:MFS family permease